MSPNTIDKYLYTRNVSTWKIRIMYLFGILTWLLIMFNTFFIARTDKFFIWFVIPIMILLSLHYLCSFILVLFYKQFDIESHKQFVKKYWKDKKNPSVDVYLPICGEGIEILHNTWAYVSKLNYENIKVFVLDDSKDECKQHKELAEHFGFNYIERPNKGEMKKAGNLKYAYLRTHGDIIAILDADFAPHKDFLKELVPYMSDNRNGIIQSPQYFPTDKETHRNGPLAFGGARAQEIFYRIIQVARDRLGGAHCCGTCALYRRAALDSIGGFVQMGHSEDAHTGFTLTSKGWNIKYIPVLLSIGASPNDAHAFFHQQHRWCLGNILMMIDKKFWKAKIAPKIKYCYSTGFLFYLHQPFMLLISLQLFWVLLFYNQHISFSAGYAFYPHVIWSLIFMFFFYIAPLRWGYLYAILMRAYSYCHAIITVVLGGTVGWIPTNAKHFGVSRAFSQTLKGVAIFLLINICLIAIGVRKEAFHLFNYNYFSIQFWIFYNIFLTGLVSWQMYKTMSRAKFAYYTEKIKIHTKKLSYYLWELKTGGLYISFVIGSFLLIAYFPLQPKVPEGDYIVAKEKPTISQEISSLPTTQSNFQFLIDYKPGNQSPDIKNLQEFLNSTEFGISETGPGSPGNETDFFGTSTYNALMKFQQANGIKATGILGPQTREIINTSLNNSNN